MSGFANIDKIRRYVFVHTHTKIIVLLDFNKINVRRINNKQFVAQVNKSSLVLLTLAMTLCYKKAIFLSFKRRHEV